MTTLQQNNVTYFGTLANRQSVNVGAVLAAIFGPFDGSLYGSLAFEIQNPDVTQVIDAYVDVATALAGPFSTSQWNGLMQIAPGETRAAVFPKPAQSIIRLVARADGAGVNNVILSVSGLVTFVT